MTNFEQDNIPDVWTVEHDEMCAAVTPSFHDGAQYGERLLVYTRDSSLPWNADVTVVFAPDGFGATIHNPYHDTRRAPVGNGGPERFPLTIPDGKSIHLSVSREGGIDAEERHGMICGLAKAAFREVEIALQEMEQPGKPGPAVAS